jgi:hypothetical protein
MFLSWLLYLSGFLCASEALTLNRWEDEYPLQMKLFIGAQWDILPVVQGMHPSDKGGDNSPSFIIPASPQVILQEIMSFDRNI